MSKIPFSKDDKQHLVATLQNYFHEELDQELGQFETEFLLDFISQELGAYYYNKGLQDAQAILAKKMDDLSDAIYERELPTNR